MTRGEDRVVRDDPFVALGVRERRPASAPGRRRPPGRAVDGEPRAGHRRGGRAADRADDELVALDQLDRAGVGPEQGWRLVGELLEDRGRLELRGEEAAHAGELLRERARGALALVELAALEPAARGAREPAAELEVVVGEGPLLGEEDDDEPALLAPRRVDRDREQRPDAREPAPLLAEAVVVVER